MKQTIRFCTTDDGARIAYATTGSGPPIVRTGHWLTHLEYDLKSPVWLPFIERLSEQHTFVRYDTRGTGMSDRDVETIDSDGWLRDLEAVVQDLGLSSFVLMGISQGGSTAIRYACLHPEKVNRLVLYGSYARGRAHRDSDAESNPAMIDAVCTMIQKGWGSDDESYREFFSSRYVSSDDREKIRWFNELESMSATPEMAVKYYRALSNVDVRNLLAKVRTPTLVMHARGDKAVPFQYGREFASGIAGSRFVPLEGDHHVLLEGDSASSAFHAELADFLGDKSPMIRKAAIGRFVKGWQRWIHQIHHTVEPYYVIAAVGSLVIGVISFLVNRFK